MELIKHRIILLFSLLLLIPGKQLFAQFAVKGFHVDLRIQVIPMPALKQLALQLSKGGVNTIIMEWEGTYPFNEEPLIANRYAYTREEITSFISYCKTLHLDVIPLQQSFGHVEYILRHSKYAALREDQKDYSQVNPLQEAGARELFTKLYKDLISTHSSQYVHIGGDETYLLGHSEASKEKIKTVGIGRLYGDYIKMLCEIVVSLGKRPVLWADIALKYPEALKGLPKETVFVDWNYGWDLNRFGDHQKLVNSGFEIWGAPALRSHPDNYFLTQWEKHFRNLHDFVPAARQLGYKGIVMTSWSTSGVYSSVWETTNDLQELYTIRRVYPLSGFNLLIAAYFKSIADTTPLAAKPFVESYCKTQYGLNTADADRFWKALTISPYETNQGSINQLLDSAQFALNTLTQLQPTQNKQEFEHYRLMAAIRVQYLTYQSIEQKANTPGADFKQLLSSLQQLKTSTLDKQFISLNSAWMYPAELRQENELRDAKIKQLIERLSRSR
jgi:hexosaminidase